MLYSVVATVYYIVYLKYDGALFLPRIFLLSLRLNPCRCPMRVLYNIHHIHYIMSMRIYYSHYIIYDGGGEDRGKYSRRRALI